MVERRQAMSEKNELQEVETSPVERKDGGRMDVEKTRGETYVTPKVDIYETENELVLVADVPGVAKDGVDLKLEDNVLEVTAHRVLDDATPAYAECRPASYYRAFNVSDDIDSANINASLQDGVLTVSLPKSPRAKPRKIDVKVG